MNYKVRTLKKNWESSILFLNVAHALRVEGCKPLKDRAGKVAETWQQSKKD